ERHGVDDVAVADLGEHRDFHSPAVLGAGDLAQGHEARLLGALAGLAGRRKTDDLGDLGRRRQLLAAVERCKKSHAHKDAGSDAGEERSGEPPRGNLAPVRRPAAAVRDQRRFAAEFGYNLLRVLHQERLLSPGGFFAFSVSDICLSWRAKSTNGASAALSKSAGACIGVDHAWSFRTPLRREWGLQVRRCKHLPMGKETAAESVWK